MLKKILSISGKPGLFKLVSQAKGMLIVESLLNGKRMPAYAHDKVTSLVDISIYTEGEDAPLREVFESIKQKEQGKTVQIQSSSDGAAYKEYLNTVLPDYDKERVYLSDIKRIINWYNLLVEKGLDDFKQDDENEE